MRERSYGGTTAAVGLSDQDALSAPAAHQSGLICTGAAAPVPKSPWMACNNLELCACTCHGHTHPTAGGRRCWEMTVCLPCRQCCCCCDCCCCRCCCQTGLQAFDRSLRPCCRASTTDVLPNCCYCQVSPVQALRWGAPNNGCNGAPLRGHELCQVQQLFILLACPLRLLDAGVQPFIPDAQTQQRVAGILQLWLLITGSMASLKSPKTDAAAVSVAA